MSLGVFSVTIFDFVRVYSCCRGAKKIAKLIESDNMKNVIGLMATFAIGFLCDAATADIVFSSNFVGNTGAVVLAGNTDNTTGSASLGITDWVTDAGVSAVSGLTAISTGDSGTLGGFAQLQGGTATYAGPDNVFLSRNHNQDTDRTTSQRGFSLDFTVTGSFALDNLTVLSGHTNNSGNQDQAFTSDLIFELSGGTLVGTVSGSSNEDYAVAPDYHPVAFDVTGNTLNAGDYNLRVYQSNMPGGGAYATYDGIALNSVSVVPEPSSMAVLGLGMASVLVRRRKR